MTENRAAGLSELQAGREFKIHVDDPAAETALATATKRLVTSLRPDTADLVLLCIGTDRSTGDCLGPLTGTLMAEGLDGRAFVYGTLEQPVHASNLQETMSWVRSRHPYALTVAIDACLGRLDSVGTLTLGRGALRPGAGVNKSLPAVGDIYLTGVVNVGGFMEYFVLQNTRLHLVLRMARVISTSVSQALADGQPHGTSTDKAWLCTENSVGTVGSSSPSAWQ